MKRKNLTIILSTTAIIISLSAIIMQLFVFSANKPDDDEAYLKMVSENCHSFAPIIPDNLTFCNQNVPLDNIYVRESLDRELSYLVFQHASTFMVIKRAFRFFPEIEPVLKKNNVPDDLKFLAVAESALANAVSPVKAEGFWQFMPATAKEFGLTVTSEYDERYNLEKATDAACHYLKGSCSRLGNNWALACAAYNCGEGGIKNRMKEQEINSYWELHLNSETARYVYRIMAYKIIMQNPKLYGFYIREKDCYQPMEYDTVTVDSTINNFYEFSRQIGVPYKYFRLSNPELREKKLTNTQHKIFRLRKPTQNSLSWKYLTGKLDNASSFVEGF